MVYMYRVEDGPSAAPKDVPEYLAERYYRSKNWVFHKNAKVPVDYGDGTYGEEKQQNLWKVLDDGGSYDTLAQRTLRREKKDFEGKNLETFAYGMGHGVGGGWFDAAAENIMDLPEGYIEKLEKHNPILHGAGMMLGFGGAAYATGGGSLGVSAGARGAIRGGAMLTPGGLAFKTGAMAEGLIARKMGIRASEEALKKLTASQILGRTGVAAGVGAGLENVVFEGHSKLGEHIWGDADMTGEQLRGELGFAAILGGGLGGAIGMSGGAIGKGIGLAMDNVGKPLNKSALKLWAKWLSGKGGKEGAEKNLKDLTETLIDPTLRGQVQGVNSAVDKAAKETQGFLNDIGSKAQRIVNFSRSRTKEGDLAEQVTEDNLMGAIRAAQDQINEMRKMARVIIDDPESSTATGHRINELADELEQQVLGLWRNTDGASGIEVRAAAIGEETLISPDAVARIKENKASIEQQVAQAERRLEEIAAERAKPEIGFKTGEGSKGRSRLDAEEAKLLSALERGRAWLENADAALAAREAALGSSPEMQFQFTVGEQGPKRKLTKEAIKEAKERREFAEAQGEIVEGLRDERIRVEGEWEASQVRIDDLERELAQGDKELDALLKVKARTRGEKNRKRHQIEDARKALEEKRAEMMQLSREAEALEGQYYDLDESYERQAPDIWERSGRIREEAAAREKFESGARTPEEVKALEEQIRLSQFRSIPFVKRLYFRMDNIKKSYGHLLENGEFPREAGISPTEREAREAAGRKIEGHYDITQQRLEKEDLWGGMGPVQKEWNLAATEWLDIRDATRELLKPIKKGEILKRGTKDRPFDYNALRDFIDQLRQGEAGGAASLFDEYIAKTERLVRMAETHFGPRMEKEGIRINIKEMRAGAQRMKDALEEIRKLQNTEEMLQERFPDAKAAIRNFRTASRALGLVGAGAGHVSLPVVVAAEGAGLLGTAINEPLWALRRFGQVAALKQKFSDTIDKAARKTAKRMAQQGGDGTIKGAYRAKTGVRGGRVRGAINMLKTLGIHEHLRDPHRQSVIAKDTEEVIRILDGLQGNPQLLNKKIEESLNHLDGAPNTQEALRQQTYGALYYMLNNLPLGISRSVDAFTGETKYAITDSAAREFMDVFTVLVDPVVVPEKMADGGLTVAEAKAFRDQFPKLWEQFKVGVFERVVGKDIPFSSKMQLSILFGEALTPMANPAMVGVLQQQYAPKPEEGNKPSRAKLKAIGDRAEQMMTPSQRAFAT